MSKFPTTSLFGVAAALSLGLAAGSVQAEPIDVHTALASGIDQPVAEAVKAPVAVDERFSLETLANASPVPEPASLMLFGSGLTLVGSVIRKRVVKP